MRDAGCGMRDQKELRVAWGRRVPRRFGDDRRWGVGRGSRGGAEVLAHGQWGKGQGSKPLSQQRNRLAGSLLAQCPVTAASQFSPFPLRVLRVSA